MPKRTRGQFEGNKKTAKRFKGIFKKKAPIIRNTSRMKAMLKSIEHKSITNSVSNIAISKATNCVGWTIDPVPGICCPIQGLDVGNRDGRDITVDQLEIKGVVTFLGAEDVINTPLGQNVHISLMLDTQTNQAAAFASENAWNNSSGTKYTNTCPLRNINDMDRWKTLGVSIIEKPDISITQTGANLYSWGSKVMPFHFFKKFDPPIKIHFSSTNAGNTTDVMDNSFHITAVTGGNVDATLATADDCTLSYNCRSRFYG